jgi:HSP20 family protein
MADKRTELTKSDKRELATQAEQTRPGPVFTPVVDIYESANELTLVADLPGVEPKDLKLDLREGVLTLSGSVDRPERPGEEPLLKEYEVGSFYRQFTLSDTIDQSQIEAQLADGVLHLHLPKVEAVKPRQITVRAG